MSEPSSFLKPSLVAFLALSLSTAVYAEEPAAAAKPDKAKKLKYLDTIGKFGDMIWLNDGSSLTDNAVASSRDESWSGKFRVVDIWAPWCGPCIEAMPHLNKLANKKEFADVDFSGIVIAKYRADINSTKSAASKILGNLKKEGPEVKIHLAFDSNSTLDDLLYLPLDIDAFPATVVIDAKSRFMWTGTPDALNDDLLRAIITGKFVPERDEFQKRAQRAATRADENALMENLETAYFGALKSGKWAAVHTAADAAERANLDCHRLCNIPEIKFLSLLKIVESGEKTSGALVSVRGVDPAKDQASTTLTIDQAMDYGSAMAQFATENKIPRLLYGLAGRVADSSKTRKQDLMAAKAWAEKALVWMGANPEWTDDEWAENSKTFNPNDVEFVKYARIASAKLKTRLTAELASAKSSATLPNGQFNPDGRP